MRTHRSKVPNCIVDIVHANPNRIQELRGYKNLDPPGALHHEEHILLHNPSEWMHYAFTVAGKETQFMKPVEVARAQ